MNQKYFTCFSGAELHPRYGGQLHLLEGKYITVLKVKRGILRIGIPKGAIKIIWRSDINLTDYIKPSENEICSFSYAGFYSGEHPDF